jgi:hypothetical protein
MRIVFAWTAALVGLVLVLPLLLVVVFFRGVSACTRAVARVLEPDYLTRDQLIEFDPVFGWKPRANLNTHHLMVDVFRIATDAQGWRGRSTLADSQVVVFGDSFAAGYGVDEDQLFANLHAQPLIKPIGIGGYSMVQELLWMNELASSLQGKLVVWFIYLGNDLYDNLSPDLRGYRKPFVREVRGTSDWEICRDHVSRERWPIQRRTRKGHIHMATLAELCSDTFLAERAYRACEFLVRRGHEICRQVGADLTVLTVPDVHQLSVPGHSYLRSLAPHAERFDPENDCHWNALGHRRIARLLGDLHAARGRQTRSRLQQAFPVNGELEAVAKTAS